MWLTLALGTLAFFGHLMFWVSVNNKLHSLPLHYLTIRRLEKLIYAIAGLIPVAWVLLITYVGIERLTPSFFWEHGWSTALYFILSWSSLAIGVPAWASHRFARVPRCLVSNHTTRIHVTDAQGKRPIGDSLTARVFAAIPKNELFDLDLTEKQLRVSNLPPGLEGFSIAHLSDLHFTGRIARSFFDEVVNRANQMDADLAVITGDIVDVEACLDWIDPTLGRLRARYGVYVLLGNHDQRLPDIPRERRLLTDAGLIDIGNRSMLLDIHGAKLRLVGNELPWFTPEPTVPPRGAPSHEPAAEFRLLLSHSPDQLEWARRHDFDLLLAGHTHGGQIRFPLLGPIVAPSWYGVRYASGVFQADSLVMHVSRGISGLDPLRFNCAPELAKLTLGGTAS